MSTQSKSTPGPWMYMSQKHKHLVCADNGRLAVSEVPFWDDVSYEANEANARLIAAAPELLGMLKAVTQLLHKTGLHVDVVKMVDAAIAKAEGRA